jgi:hypothetical protein
MTGIAREKLASRPEVRWILADVLECLHPPHASAAGRLDQVVSTYTLHHLLPDERRHLFDHLSERLPGGGRIVVGDLMFANAEARATFVRDARARGDDELADTVEDEFFWLLDEELPRLAGDRLRIETRRFSDLSWGLLAVRAD